MPKITREKIIENKILISQWNYDKNVENPADLTTGSNKEVWWICEEKHEWSAKINDRSRGNGCPYCSGKKVLSGYNDLQTIYPNISAEWNYDKNQLLSPNQVSKSSGKKVWWKCKNGHEWQAIISDRVRGNGCPVCANKKIVEGYNDFKSCYPELMNEWNYDKNILIKPEQLSAGSGKKVWWRCREGHEWEAYIYSRVAGTNCPYCAGEKTIRGINDLETLFPSIAYEWNYEKNKGIMPCEIMPNSGKKVWWKCELGHEWYVSPNSRVSSNTGCPICSNERHTSFPEQAIYYYLAKEFEAKNRYNYDGYEIDVYLPQYKIAIEYDGIFYHSSQAAHEREQKKENYLIKNNISMIRVKEVEENLDNTSSVIYRNLRQKEDGLNCSIEALINMLNKICATTFDINIDVHRDRDEIWALYILGSKENSLLSLYPKIAEEWNYEKNQHLSPDQISFSSHKKVWWKCQLGHEWIADAHHRINGNGCPFCANKKVLKGFNDLESLYPELMREWNYEKNEVQPSEVTKSSGKKVWWKCSLGHEWQATISTRTNGRNCPICANKKILKGYNDLKTRYPRIALDWNYEKNSGIPEDVFPFSNKKVWWKCKCGYEWKATINSRSKGNKCPSCHCD